MAPIQHGRRLLTAFFLIVVLGVGLCSYNYSNTQRATSVTARLVNRDIPTLRAIDDLKIAIVRQEPILYEYYAAMDGERFRTAYAENETQITKGLQLLNATFPGQPELAEIATHHVAMSGLAEELHRTMSNAKGVDWDLAREILARNTREANKLNAEVDVLLLSLRDAVQERGQQAQAAMDTISLSVLTFGCGLLLFGGIAGFSIRAYLRESRERHRLYLIPLRNPNPILTIDNGYNILFANPGTEIMLARLRMSSQMHHRLLPDNLRDHVAELSAAAANGVREFDYEKGDVVFHCKLSYQHDLGITYIYLADVTAERRAAQAMRQAMEAAEAANLAKSQFLANMSHEIRTPMNGVLGMTELMLGTELNGDQRSLVLTIQRSGSNLLTLINDILDISKIEAGKFELDSMPFSPTVVAQDCVQLLGESARTKGLVLRLDLDARIPNLILGDGLRFQQVLVNLIGNAIKFTAVGEVRLGMRLLMPNSSMVNLQVSVEDTGIGIAASVQEHIFEAFAQADGSTTRQYGGTGLGLAISRKIVRLMGSELLLKSEPGQGARFWFDLTAPIAHDVSRPQSPTAPLPGSSQTHGGERHEVLLVEDNPVNQVLAVRILEQLGYNPRVANTGVEAVEWAGTTRFDLILMDCQMPEMDGFEATRRIRAAEAPGQRVPIIALTANALTGDREKCLQCGMDDYLSKPFKKHELEVKLTLWHGAFSTERSAIIAQHDESSMIL